MSVQVEKWKALSDFVGSEVHLITLKNSNGYSVELTNFGCILMGIYTPDREGNFENILLTYDLLEAYVKNEFYLNATIGPVAGRLKNGELPIEDKVYKLQINNDINCLHSGDRGLHQVVWCIEATDTGADFDEVTLKHHHRHLEDGFPGNMDLYAVYRLNHENELSITFKASTDRPTAVNLTNHNYYNLSGKRLNKIDDQLLFVNAEYYREVDAHCLPLDIMTACAGTPFDFTELSPIGTALSKGIDNPFGIAFKIDEGMPDIEYADPVSGRVMSIKTNQEAVVIYSNNGPFKTHRAICFETQGYPNQIYKLDSTTPYVSETTLKFGVMNR